MTNEENQDEEIVECPICGLAMFIEDDAGNPVCLIDHADDDEVNDA